MIYLPYTGLLIGYINETYNDSLPNMTLSPTTSKIQSSLDFTSTVKIDCKYTTAFHLKIYNDYFRFIV
ncbi:hypothetical protein KGI01_12850 [Kurthia gibsonii]|nr:hypothetical protein KGI01_12850 [Kurthia gibsonii]